MGIPQAIGHWTCSSAFPDHTDDLLEGHTLLPLQSKTVELGDLRFEFETFKYL
jgi:hypothetical protein